jgi:hypothetical protein
MRKKAGRGNKFAKNFLRLTSKRTVRKINQSNEPLRQTVNPRKPPPFGGGKRHDSLLIK